MGDLNCKVGSISNDSIGECAPDFEDLGGERFRKLCQRWDLVVPSTWDDWHHGRSDTYFTSHGHGSCIGYIAVSNECRMGIRQSFVDYDIDLLWLNGDSDHFPLRLDLDISFKPQKPQGFKKIGLYDIEAARAYKDCCNHNEVADLLHAMPL